VTQEPSAASSRVDRPSERRWQWLIAALLPAVLTLATALAFQRATADPDAAAAQHLKGLMQLEALVLGAIAIGAVLLSLLARAPARAHCGDPHRRRCCHPVRVRDLAAARPVRADRVRPAADSRTSRSSPKAAVARLRPRRRTGWKRRLNFLYSHRPDLARAARAAKAPLLRTPNSEKVITAMMGPTTGNASRQCIADL
jgi:hypothetical protein